MIKQSLKEKLFGIINFLLGRNLKWKIEAILKGKLLDTIKVNFIRIDKRKEVCTLDSLLTLNNGYIISYTITDTYTAYYFYNIKDNFEKIEFAVYSDKNKKEFNLIEEWKSNLFDRDTLPLA